MSGGLASKRRRIIQELSIHEPITAGVVKSSSTVEIRLGSWLVDQLDAHTVAAIALAKCCAVCSRDRRAPCRMLSGGWRR